MAAHSNRSPSPHSSRPSSPNPRISENARRSFNSSNPFSKPSAITNSRGFDLITPANSPSDLSRRSSIGKEGTESSCLKDTDEKENGEKDLNSKALKLRYPVKGCKNFMSPTISAASKFTPSPRKKVLAERNDPVRTSMSISDGKIMFFSSCNVSEDLESKAELGTNLNQTTEISLGSTVANSQRNEVIPESPVVSKPVKRVTFSDVSSEITDSDGLKLEPGLKNKISCSSISPSIAPLDADPSMPPYDPKTNYLSPRPQYLHYKPKSRTENLLSEESELGPDIFERLEDCFIAEIISDNFSGPETEESQSEYSHESEPEYTAPADMVLGLDETADDVHVSEPSERLPLSTNAMIEVNLVQEKAKKPWALCKIICVSALLMFLIACISISVTHPTAVDQLVFKDLALSDVSKLYHQSSVVAHAKVNFKRAAGNVNQFICNSVAFISELCGKGEGKKPYPLKYLNLTMSHENTWSRENVLNDEVNEELVQNREEYKSEEEEDVFTEVTFDEEVYADDNFDESCDKEFNPQDMMVASEEVSLDSVMESEKSLEEVVSHVTSGKWNGKGSEEQSDAIVQDEEGKLETERTEVSPDKIGTLEYLEGDILVKLRSGNAENSQNQEVVPHVNFAWHSGRDSEDQSADISQVEEREVEAKIIEVASDSAETGTLCGSTPSEFAPLDPENSLSEVLPESPSGKSEDKYLPHYVLGVSFAIAALSAVATYINQQKKNNSLGDAADKSNILMRKQTECGFVGVKHMHHQEKPFSQKWQTNVADAIGELSPSETTSFLQSASNLKGLRGATEVQSVERKSNKYYTRESLASSTELSTGSPSYGSFTTYEKIPIKHANGEDEIVTPVRRSSRIRNQITSPNVH